MLNLEPKRVFHFFEEMDKIPRQSGNEKGISDWILAWAKEQGLDAVQDELYNIVIKKPASAGYEDKPPVMMQAHMDMVCEKLPESDHDFTKDPIKLKVDGDWVVTDSGTSIGADNGIGVAFAMAVLEDDSLKHPPLEAVFTVDEEGEFSGASGISPAIFESKRMINLDNAAERQVVAGSCGGSGLNFEMPVKYAGDDEVTAAGTANDAVYYALKIGGMEGGHSGEDINRGRGNAIELMARFLRNAEIGVCSIQGGSYRLAIPRDCSAVIRIDKAWEKDFIDYAEEMKKMFCKEYFVAAPELFLEIETADAAPVLRTEDKDKIIRIVDLFPNGIVKMNGAIPGVVESSNNVGTIDVSDGRLLITAEIRGAYVSTVEDIKDKVDSLAALVDAKVSYFGGYVPWEYNPKSDLRALAQKVYLETFDEEMEALVVHAGLECAMFVDKVPEMDAISVGPYCQYFHSPMERLSIKSTKKMYEYLKVLLERL